MLWRCQFPELAKPGPRACGPGFFFDETPAPKKRCRWGSMNGFCWRRSSRPLKPCLLNGATQETRTIEFSGPPVSNNARRKSQAKVTGAYIFFAALYFVQRSASRRSPCSGRGSASGPPRGNSAWRRCDWPAPRRARCFGSARSRSASACGFLGYLVFAVLRAVLVGTLVARPAGPSPRSPASCSWCRPASPPPGGTWC